MITVRPRTPTDDAALAALFEEMQTHYGRSCPSIERVLGDLSSLPAGVTILVAETDRIVGLAAFSAIYPGPGLASGVFLKELFVTRESRAVGIGSALMRAVAAWALEHGHQRVDWTAARDNARLLEYYEGLGAIKQEDKAFFRLTGEALRTLASEQN